MAVFATSSGAGGHTGVDIDNAYSWAELITNINDSTIGDGVECRVCGDIDHGGTGQTITRSPSGANPIQIVGYNAGGTAEAEATIGSVTPSTLSVLNIAANYYVLRNLVFANTSGSGDQGMTTSGCVVCVDCKATDVDDGFYCTGYYARFIRCVSYSNRGNGFETSRYRNSYINCVARSNALNGFQGGSPCFNCLSFSNNFGFQVITANHCTAYNNTFDGFYRFGTTLPQVWQGCVSVSNGRDGYAANTGRATLIDCASYNNTSGRDDGMIQTDINPIILTGDPFADAAGGDYRPNDTVGAGADLRAVVNLWDGRTDHRDIGGFQSDPGAGGGSSLVRSHGIFISKEG